MLVVANTNTRNVLSLLIKDLYYLLLCSKVENLHQNTWHGDHEFPLYFAYRFKWEYSHTISVGVSDILNCLSVVIPAIISLNVRELCVMMPSFVI